MHSFFTQLSQLSNVKSLPEHLAVEVLAENLLNAGTRSYSPHSHIIRGLADVFIPSGTVQPLTGLRCYSDASCRIFGQSGRGLLVHPNTVDKSTLMNRGRLGGRSFSEHRFFALSSLRSVIYETADGWRRGKLHLEDVQISRYFRNLGGRTIEHSVAVSRAVSNDWEKVQQAYQHSVALGFYEEFGGTVLKNSDESDRTGEWGSLERSLVPLGCEEELAAIPMFALYGKPAGRADSPSLLETLIRESGENPADYLFHRIMEPVIRAWVAVFETTGVIWEPHAQNVLFLCDVETMEPKAIALRDADTAVSRTKRDELNLSCDTFFDRNVHDGIADEEMPQGDRSEISRVIDVSMGRNSFDYLAALYRDVFGGSSEELQLRCRDLFAEIWPESVRWLPVEVYGYANEPLPDDRNCYPLEAKRDRQPIWRPAS